MAVHREHMVDTPDAHLALKDSSQALGVGGSPRADVVEPPLRDHDWRRLRVGMAQPFGRDGPHMLVKGALDLGKARYRGRASGGKHQPCPLRAHGLKLVERERR